MAGVTPKRGLAFKSVFFHLVAETLNKCLISQASFSLLQSGAKGEPACFVLCEIRWPGTVLGRQEVADKCL